ncbi:aminoglycoside phosphotransferase family protein [Kribbella shirazensis]|uniref:Aminoglycoside phosphotransferase (APT) family kinase protein n=1 Tax=Kribbella shirazensis TaxID=1105143 RepID=A0A7X5V7F7_9ACTN|nr:aminoglycoside phosphotransferase (APT) family kinase protein [Kribbella shirazensis]
MDVAQLVRNALGVEVGETTVRTGGQLSAVHEVQTSADPVIVKAYAPEWRWKQAKEVHVYGMLEPEVGGSVPRVLHVGDGFTILTKLDGVPLSELEPPDWRTTYAQLGELLRRIHRTAQPEYGYLTDQILDPLPDNDQYMRRQFTKKLHEFEQLGGDPKLHAKIAGYVDQHAGLFADNTAPVLCHNDFHEGNILVDPATWRVNGFIDVENAIAADPLLDVAKTIAYSVRDNDEKLAGLTAGYGPLPAGRIALYRLYHALELWDWFSSIGEATHLDSIARDMAGLVDG